MAAFALARLAALCLLCLCAVPPAGAAQSFYGAVRALARRLDSAAGETALGEYVLLVGKPSVALYTPLDANASAYLLKDSDAVPDYSSCAHFNHSVYCVGGESVKTWRFDSANGSPLPPGPDLNRTVFWPGNGRMANINDEWLVTCGDWRADEPHACQALHANAGHWEDVEAEAAATTPAVAEHNGSVFLVGGWHGIGVTADVWSLAVGQTAAGSDAFQWQRHPDMNTPRDELGIASHNGYLYACGGASPQAQPSILSDCERWRAGMDSWQSVAPLPQPRYRLHLLSVGGRLIAMGGHDDYGVYQLDVFDYNEAEDTWSRLHHMPDVSWTTWLGSAVVPAL